MSRAPYSGKCNISPLPKSICLILTKNPLSSAGYEVGGCIASSFGHSSDEIASLSLAITLRTLKWRLCS